MFESQGKIRGSGKVRKNLSARVQKLTKMQEKISTVLCRLRTAVQFFFCLLRLQIIYISAFELLLPPLFLV